MMESDEEYIEKEILTFRNVWIQYIYIQLKQQWYSESIKKPKKKLLSVGLGNKLGLWNTLIYTSRIF